MDMDDRLRIGAKDRSSGPTNQLGIGEKPRPIPGRLDHQPVCADAKVYDGAYHRLCTAHGQRMRANVDDLYRSGSASQPKLSPDSCNQYADMVRTRPTRLDISGTTRLKFETTEAMVGTLRASLARRYHASPAWTWASMSAHL